MSIIIMFIFAFVIGIVTYFFGTLLLLSINLSSFLFPYNLLLIPIVGISTAFLKRRNKNLDGSMKRIISASTNGDHVPFIVVPFQFFITILTHFSGASVGREGVAVQLGGTIANYFSSFSKKWDSKLFTKAGMACGFAGLFGTPIAASVFSFEISNNKINIKEFLLILCGSYISYITSSVLGLEHFKVNLDFARVNIISFIIALLIFALVGNLFAIGLKGLKKQVAKYTNREYRFIFFVSIFLIILLYITNGRYTSLGTNLIDLSFNGEVYVYDFLLKSIFTLSFISIGFQGGEVTPLFAIGSTLGITLASIFNLPYGILAASGYVFVFANATNSLIASFFLMIEVFSWSIWPYAFLLLLVGLCVRRYKYSIYQ